MEEKTKYGRLSITKVTPYMLMVLLQFGFAGRYIISMICLNHGVSRLVLIVYRNAVITLTMAPFAIVLERKIWPKLTTRTVLQITALVFLEQILYQNLVYLGAKYTSVSFASVIMNAVPAVTFLIAIILRIEQVKIKEARSQAKIIGTIVTLCAALVMTLYRGPIVNLLPVASIFHHTSNSNSMNQHWVTGTLFILAGCCAWSPVYILHSEMEKTYPAELSLSTLISFMSTVQTAVLAVSVEHHPSAWAIGLDTTLIAPLYSGIVNSGLTDYVQGLVMKERGPVFVTAFNPLCMIIVAVLDSLILAEKIHLGSVIGAIIIAVGLYAVVWGKSKDQSGPITATDVPRSISRANDGIEDL